MQMPSHPAKSRVYSGVLLAAICCGCMSTDAGQIGMTGDKEKVWEKEVAIFEGRANGDLSFYVDAADEAYMAWPFGLPEPIVYETFKEQAAAGAALKGEQLELTEKGVSIQGDTAVSYFRTHRTRLGEAFGSDAERDVDQYFDNIHVWIRDGDDWKIIGGLSRLLAEPPESGAD